MYQFLRANFGDQVGAPVMTTKWARSSFECSPYPRTVKSDLDKKENGSPKLHGAVPRWQKNDESAKMISGWSENALAFEFHPSGLKAADAPKMSI